MELGKVFVAAFKRLHVELDPAALQQAIDAGLAGAGANAAPKIDSIEAAVLARERELSVYDALIIAAALDAGCRLLFTEDLQHGQKIGAMTVEDPSDFIDARRVAYRRAH